MFLYERFSKVIYGKFRCLFFFEPTRCRLKLKYHFALLMLNGCSSVAWNRNFGPIFSLPLWMSWPIFSERPNSYRILQSRWTSPSRYAEMRAKAQKFISGCPEIMAVDWCWSFRFVNGISLCNITVIELTSYDNKVCYRQCRSETFVVVCFEFTGHWTLEFREVFRT